MNGNLLSPVHIQKLGHSIEEIRLRALQSVWSKYNLELVDESNSENTKFLLVKLLDWFNFETHPYEDKVLKLILKIIRQKGSDCVIKDMNLKQLSRKINEIKKHVDGKCFSTIDEIQAQLIEIEDKTQHISQEFTQLLTKSNEKDENDSASTNLKGQELHSEDYLIGVHQGLYTKSNFDTDEKMVLKKKCIYHDYSPNKSVTEVTDTRTRSQHKEETPENFHTIRIDNFPWKLLVITDSTLLSSVYDGLRYIDNVNSILHSCQLYIDILLQDFPTEIFLQRTLLIQTLYEIIGSEEPKICLSAINCLLATVKHLHNRFENFLDLSVTQLESNHRDNILVNTCMSENSNFEKNKLQNFVTKYSDFVLEVEEDFSGIKEHEFSVLHCCFSVLAKTLPHLSKERSLEEYNLIFELVLETCSLLTKNLVSLMWCNKEEIKESLYKIFCLFIDPLKYNKTKNCISYNIIVHVIVKMINLLQPPTEIIQQILPHCIQLELVECVSDYMFILLYPNLNSIILSFMSKFSGGRRNEIFENYKVTLELCNSIKAAVQFMKHCSKLKTKLEKLKCVQKGLACLEFHKNIQFIRDFMSNCVFKWTDCHLARNEVELRKSILLKLLSHGDEEVKLNVYKEFHAYVIKYLGVDMTQKPAFQYSGSKFRFLFDSDILMEMTCYGLNCSQIEIHAFCSEIFIHLLKGKVFFTDDDWSNFVRALTPCLPMLQCFADKSTDLGRCIFKMLDPDISKTVSLSPLDLIRGNLRLLFSKNHLIREEALLRLFWLLAKEDPDKIKLPRLNLLRGLNLSSVCSSVAPEEYSRMKQSFYSTESMNNVMEMLSADNIEPSVRRSALSQLSVMLEDSNLHGAFLERKGLQIILDIFKNCLIEKEYQNYPDSVVPIMSILKFICFDNPSVRLQLSQNFDLYYCILRALLLFNSERHSRQQGVELLCLLLYNECIVNTLNERAVRCKISVPEILINNICLPFQTCIHARCSKHTEPSIRESIMMKEKTAGLMRIYWNSAWLGGISKVLALENNDPKQNMFSSSLPSDMMLQVKDLEYLKDCSITFGIQRIIFGIQNATSHDVVITSLHKLNSYLLLYELDKGLEEADELNNLGEAAVSLLDLQWETTFQRFLSSIPSCEDDEILLFQVVRTVRLLLRIVNSEDLQKWIERLLTIESEILPVIFKSYGLRNSGLVHRDLTRVITGLIKDAIVWSNEDHPDVWFLYVNMITRLLKPIDSETYNIVYIDWLMSILADVTGLSGQKIVHGSEIYTETITRVMEIIVTFYCNKESQNSFIGTSVIRNCLFVLNNVLNYTQSTVQDWERLWYHALSEVTGQAGEANYCWFLSLWFFRDPMIRVLAIQLIAGFSLTCRSCELLLEHFNIEYEYLWNESFKFLLDNNECNLVRESASLLLSNLTYRGSVTTAMEFLQNLLEISFYDKLFEIYERLNLGEILNGTTGVNSINNSEMHNERIASVHEAVAVNNKMNSFKPHEKGTTLRHYTTLLSMSTPSLISAVNLLLINVIFLNPGDVVDVLLCTGLLENLIKIFSDIFSVCSKPEKGQFGVCITKMYATGCKLIAKCMTSKDEAYSLIQRSTEFIDSMIYLMNSNLYDEITKDVLEQRNRLWCEILDVLSMILIGPEPNFVNEANRQRDGFEALDRAIMSNGSCFASALYVAASSTSRDLRYRCLCFLNNFFTYEPMMSRQQAITYLLETNINVIAIQHAETLSWKGLSICKVSDLNFGKRICDVLIQSYNMCNHAESEFKALVPNTLGSLLARCEFAQNYCIGKGIAEDIAKGLQAAFIKLSLENIDCLRKAADRKRLDPVLKEVETYFRLLTNLLIGNQKAKAHLTNIGLSSLVHKLWHWCTARDSLLAVTLKMLITFTLKSDPACRSLAMDKSWIGIGLKKPQGPTALINTLMQHIGKEMSFLYKSQNVESVSLSFQLLENCCSVTECRCLITKGPLIQLFGDLFHSLFNKRRGQFASILGVWYDFFIILTSYQEGQLALAKNQDALEAVIYTASSLNWNYRTKALKILRNLTFHQLNKVQLLSHYQFLNAMVENLKLGDNEVVNFILQAFWGLIHNSQKGKLIVRNAGLEDILKEIRVKLKLLDEPTSLSLIDCLSQILKNK